jgi:exopolysaccharide biosynthesis polyprenyl glycosylphosphotransferase
MRSNEVSELVIADPNLPREEVSELVYMCEHEGFSYKLAADVFDLVSMTARVVHMGGTTMVESVPPPLEGGRSLIKRALDLIVAVPALLILFPLGLVVAAAVVLDTGFPVFYSQIRLGRGNRPFRMIKYRSMRLGAHDRRGELESTNEASGPLFKMRDDPRVTRVGRFIRKWSIDELPQLYNVIAGSMSLVGPRPPLREEVEDYTERHLKRLQTIPGITGVWQISGRSNLSFSEMIKLDLYYVDNWSIWMDVSIILLTIPAVLVRKGAY